MLDRLLWLPQDVSGVGVRRASQMLMMVPVAATSFDWNCMSGLIGAFIGGFFTFLATWITLRHEIRKIRIREITRLNLTKRWEVITETYSLLAKTYLALRAMLHPQSEEESSRTINHAWKTWKEFNNFYFQSCVSLPPVKRMFFSCIIYSRL